MSYEYKEKEETIYIKTHIYRAGVLVFNHPKWGILNRITYRGFPPIYEIQIGKRELNRILEIGEEVKIYYENEQIYPPVAGRTRITKRGTLILLWRFWRDHTSLIPTGYNKFTVTYKVKIKIPVQRRELRAYIILSPEEYRPERKAKHYPTGAFQGMYEADLHIDENGAIIEDDLYRDTIYTIRKDLVGEIQDYFYVFIFTEEDVTVGISDRIPDQKNIGKGIVKINLQRTIGTEEEVKQGTASPQWGAKDSGYIPPEGESIPYYYGEKHV